MELSYNVAIIFAAALIEAAFGYPHTLQQSMRHPVQWAGALLDHLEQRLNPATMPERRRRLNGALALAILLGAAMLPAAALQFILHAWLPGWLFVIVAGALASSLIAQRSLEAHVQAVADALRQGGVEAGRRAVSRIVGRDTDTLDEAGIARAAIESLAENFSDGVVAPIFWGVLAGLVGIAGYKAANTADSMIGHRTPRFAAFGWAAAKLDDALNVFPARLSAGLIAVAALFHPKADSRGAITIARRDAFYHRSPNAGWPEGAMAGALNIKLAGPRLYHGTMTDDRFLGDGREEADAQDIVRALQLYRTACSLLIVALGLGALLIWRG